MRQGFDDGDFRAEGLPHRGEFDTDNTPTQDNGTAGDVIEEQSVFRTQDASPQIHPQVLGVGTRSQHYVLAAQHSLPGGNGVRAGETPARIAQLDILGLDQVREALVHLVHHAGLKFLDLGHVHAGEGRGDAPIQAFFYGVGNFGCSQQGFGGDTSAVQAGASHLVFLDHRHAHSQPSCTQGTGVTAVSAA